MLFHSLPFLVFAAAFFCGWPWLRRNRQLRWSYLTLASFFFYGWWDWRFLSLILISGTIDFAAGLGMYRFPSRRRLLLALSLLGNLGILGTFKYLDFVTRNLTLLLSNLPVDVDLPEPHLTLPLGISFYTFQSLSYTIDVYRGKLRPTRHFFHFMAYLSMFPQLVAGPIVRAANMLPQLEREPRPTPEQRWEGFRRIVYGFFKKMVVADTLAPIVSGAFEASPDYAASGYWWMIMVMFALQIYCDFSGYTDIARGLAQTMGLDIRENFRHPYAAPSVREFWRRWHISLSSWFRDYVYIPLGGSRRGPLRSHLALWVTMLASGLWHGAAWTFVLWGALHALYVSVERITRWPERLSRLPGGRHLATLLVFALVTLAWTLFRSQTLGQATDILGAMLSFDFSDLSEIGGVEDGLLVAALVLGREAWFALGLDSRGGRFTPIFTVLRPVGLALLIAGCIFLRGPGHKFIYFAF